MGHRDRPSNPEGRQMRLIARLIFELAFSRYWQRRLTDQYAILVADVGLTREETEMFLRLRRAR
jgi:hypothetical protein